MRRSGESDGLPIYSGSAQDFRLAFKRLAALQGAGAWGLRPHSIRRGGATAFFRATGSMSCTIERGRWATSRVARLYVCDGLATGVENLFSAELRARLRREGAQVRAFLEGISATWSRVTG